MMKYFMAAFLFVLSANAYAQTNNLTQVDFQDDDWVQIAENMSVETIAKLKSENFDFKGVDNQGNPLFYYVLTQNPQPDIVSEMLAAGADANQNAANGMLPLNVSTSKANELQLQVLMMQNMGLDIHNPQIKQTLEENIFNEMSRMSEVAKILIQNGADVNKVSPLGTPLMNAATNAWNMDIVKLLIDAGARLDEVDKDGKTALFYAAAGGNDEIIAALLAAGANPDVKDADGKTYLEVERLAAEEFSEN